MAPAARPIWAFEILVEALFLFWKLWLNFVVQVSFEASKQQKPRAEWDLMVWESCSGLQNDIFYKRFQYASWLYLVCAVFICRCPFPIHAFKNFFQPYAINRPVLEMSSPLQRRRRIWRSCRTLAGQGSTLSGFFQNLVWHLLQPITFVVHFVFQVVLLWVLCVFVSLLISGQATFRASVQLQSLERASRDHQLQANQAAWCPETWNLNLFKVFFLNWTFQAFLCSHGWKAWS